MSVAACLLLLPLLITLDGSHAAASPRSPRSPLSPRSPFAPRSPSSPGAASSTIIAFMALCASNNVTSTIDGAFEEVETAANAKFATLQNTLDKQNSKTKYNGDFGASVANLFGLGLFDGCPLSGTTATALTLGNLNSLQLTNLSASSAPTCVLGSGNVVAIAASANFKFQITKPLDIDYVFGYKGSFCGSTGLNVKASINGYIDGITAAGTLNANGTFDGTNLCLTNATLGAFTLTFTSENFSITTFAGKVTTGSAIASSLGFSFNSTAKLVKAFDNVAAKVMAKFSGGISSSLPACVAMAST